MRTVPNWKQRNFSYWYFYSSSVLNNNLPWKCFSPPKYHIHHPRHPTACPCLGILSSFLLHFPRETCSHRADKRLELARSDQAEGRFWRGTVSVTRACSAGWYRRLDRPGCLRFPPCTSDIPCGLSRLRRSLGCFGFSRFSSSSPWSDRERLTCEVEVCRMGTVCRNLAQASESSAAVDSTDPNWSFPWRCGSDTGSGFRLVAFFGYSECFSAVSMLWVPAKPEIRAIINKLSLKLEGFSPIRSEARRCCQESCGWSSP